MEHECLVRPGSVVRRAFFRTWSRIRSRTTSRFAKNGAITLILALDCSETPRLLGFGVQHSGSTAALQDNGAMAEDAANEAQ